jgi:hypothetical protein
MGILHKRCHHVVISMLRFLLIDISVKSFPLHTENVCGVSDYMTVRFSILYVGDLLIGE